MNTIPLCSQSFRGLVPLALTVGCLIVLGFLVSIPLMEKSTTKLNHGLGDQEDIKMERNKRHVSDEQCRWEGKRVRKKLKSLFSNPILCSGLQKCPCTTFVWFPKQPTRRRISGCTIWFCSAVSWCCIFLPLNMSENKCFLQVRAQYNAVNSAGWFLLRAFLSIWSMMPMPPLELPYTRPGKTSLTWQPRRST